MLKHFRFSLPLLGAALALSGPAVAAAQEPAVSEVLSGMQAALDGTADATFLVTGVLHAADGTVYPLELEVEAMPQEQVFRLEIIQPDALADNFIIVTENELYNYSWMTNQLVVYRADDPAALGPLAPAGDSAFSLTLDLSELFSGWDVEVSGSEETAEGEAVIVELSNLDPAANITRARLIALEDTWFPQALTLFTAGGDTLLDIRLSGFASGTGLDLEDLLWYPPDAELIDER